jgi:hypothetical protein
MNLLLLTKLAVIMLSLTTGILAIKIGALTAKIKNQKEALDKSERKMANLKKQLASH